MGIASVTLNDGLSWLIDAYSNYRLMSSDGFTHGFTMVNSRGVMMVHDGS